MRSHASRLLQSKLLPINPEKRSPTVSESGHSPGTQATCSKTPKRIPGNAWCSGALHCFILVWYIQSRTFDIFALASRLPRKASRHSLCQSSSIAGCFTEPGMASRILMKGSALQWCDEHPGAQRRKHRCLRLGYHRISIEDINWTVQAFMLARLPEAAQPSSPSQA